MKTIDEIDARMSAAGEAGLDGLDFMAEFDYATIAREYNGIGPEWIGEELRSKATSFLALFEPAAVVHDLRNYCGDGTRYGFNFANIEFHENCRRLADWKYPFWSWRRYRARAVAKLLYKFVCGPGGWVAWLQASEKRLAVCLDENNIDN